MKAAEVEGGGTGERKRGREERDCRSRVWKREREREIEEREKIQKIKQKIEFYMKNNIAFLKFEFEKIIFLILKFKMCYSFNYKT